VTTATFTNDILFPSAGPRPLLKAPSPDRRHRAGTTFTLGVYLT